MTITVSANEDWADEDVVLLELGNFNFTASSTGTPQPETKSTKANRGIALFSVGAAALGVSCASLLF